MQEILDKETDPWGIKVSIVEVKDVELPDTMKRAMARQAEAERERRAKVIHAEGELQASEKLRSAADIMMQNPASMTFFLQGLGNLPQLFAKRVESRWDQFMGLQNQWMGKIAEVGQRTQSFSFDDLDKQLLELWNETYNKENRR